MCIAYIFPSLDTSNKPNIDCSANKMSCILLGSMMFLLFAFPKPELLTLKEEDTALHGQVRAEVLVIVSNHGSGTTSLGDVLNTHPCIVDVGEPFGPHQILWTTFGAASTPECDGYYKDGRHTAMFDPENGKLLHAENPKMTDEINDALTREEWNKGSDVVHTHFDINTRSLYEHLEYNLAEYFVRIRDLVCAHVPTDVCPASKCSVVLKMFPNYVEADTDDLQTPSAGHLQCQTAQNAKAMKAWKDALLSFEQVRLHF